MRPVVHSNLPSIEIWPKKTFLGLDKSKAHCFTLPKAITDDVTEILGLTRESLQKRIVFVIDGLDYDAIARLVVMDRSKPNKLEKEDLPSRIVVQFQWNAFDQTCEELNYKLSSAVNSILNGDENTSHSVVFTHIRLNRFYLEFVNKNNPDLSVSISES